MKPVHLYTLFLPVGIVGLTWTPVSVCDRGGVHPSDHKRIKRHILDSEVSITKQLLVGGQIQISQKWTHMYCPPVRPNIIIPIQAAATSPVPTWRSNNTKSENHNTFTFLYM